MAEKIAGKIIKTTIIVNYIMYTFNGSSYNFRFRSFFAFCVSVQVKVSVSLL